MKGKMVSKIEVLWHILFWFILGMISLELVKFGKLERIRGFGLFLFAAADLWCIIQLVFQRRRKSGTLWKLACFLTGTMIYVLFCLDKIQIAVPGTINDAMISAGLLGIVCIFGGLFRKGEQDAEV